jgi:hypothetical protein
MFYEEKQRNQGAEEAFCSRDSLKEMKLLFAINSIFKRKKEPGEDPFFPIVSLGG